MKGIGYGLPAPDVLFHQPLTATRVVYPALSVPFTWLFGVSGMAVVPAIAFFLLAGVLLVAVAGRWGWGAALPPMVLVAASSKTLIFAAVMLTEGLTMLWCGPILLVALRRRGTPESPSGGSGCSLS